MDGLGDEERDDEQRSHPSEAQLLDVLYEALAHGVPPASRVTRAEIERFLHEHARTRKSRADMLAFFAEHALPTEPSEIGADQELGALAWGLQREHPPSLPPPSLPAARTTPAVVPPAPDDELADEATSRRAVRDVRRVRAERGVLMVALVSLALAVVGLASAFYLTHRRVTALERALSSAEAAQRAADARSRELAERAAHLERAAAESREQHARAVHALETEASTLRKAMAAAAKRHEAQGQTLDRIFGPRHRMLRQQLAKVAAAEAQ